MNMFLPCIRNYSERRYQLFKIVLSISYGLMSGWSSNTSKLGSLSHYTFELRKPILLGIMLRNGVGCCSGYIVFQDVVQNPEYHHEKKYQDKPSSIPENSTIKAHTSEVLQQVSGSQALNGG